MGCEVGQYEEWNHDGAVPWELIQFDYHRKLQNLVRALNQLYRQNASLYQVDFHYSGFEWVDFRDVENSVIAFIRRATDPNDFLLFCCNFTPQVRRRYEFGVPADGIYDEVFNSDSECFGGGDVTNGSTPRRYGSRAKSATRTVGGVGGTRDAEFPARSRTYKTFTVHSPGAAATGTVNDICHVPSAAVPDTRVKPVASGGTDTSMDLRNYGIGAQILADLGIHDMILLSNAHRNVVGLEGYGLNIVGEQPIPEA